jgi:hypothetical protein
VSRAASHVGRQAWTRSAKVTIRGAAYEYMETAYLQASANGTLPAHARQVMYAARNYIQQQTGEALDDKYFTQTLVPDYLADHPDLTAAWDVVFDARLPGRRGNIDLKPAQIIIPPRTAGPSRTRGSCRAWRGGRSRCRSPQDSAIDFRFAVWTCDRPIAIIARVGCFVPREGGNMSLRFQLSLLVLALLSAGAQAQAALVAPGQSVVLDIDMGDGFIDLTTGQPHTAGLGAPIADESRPVTFTYHARAGEVFPSTGTDTLTQTGTFRNAVYRDAANGHLAFVYQVSNDTVTAGILFTLFDVENFGTFSTDVFATVSSGLSSVDRSADGGQLHLEPSQSGTGTSKLDIAVFTDAIAFDRNGSADPRFSEELFGVGMGALSDPLNLTGTFPPTAASTAIPLPAGRPTWLRASRSFCRGNYRTR